MAKASDDGHQPDTNLAAQVKALREELARLTAAFDGHVNDNAARLDAVATEAKAAITKANAAIRDAKAAETKAATAVAQADRAETKADATAVDLEKTTDGLKDLHNALGNSKPAAPAAPGKLPDFLAIRVRQTEFDPIINRVLAEFRAEQNRNVDIARFSKEIVERGLATSIGKVSQALSRSRISETRRSILAAAYPALLKNQLGNPPKARLAMDTAGLAQNLLAELELVLEDFAEGVVKASEESLSLDLDARARKALLARVVESI